jgi:hypothetical protein
LDRFFRGDATPQVERLDVLLGSEPIAIGDLILTEVLQGVLTNKDFNHVRKLLTSLEIVELGGARVAV